MAYEYPKSYLGLRKNGYTNAEGFDEEEFDDDRITEIQHICEAYFKNAKSYNYNFSSYQMKHRMEMMTKLFYKEELGDYVSNGELIYAMLEAGFKVKRNGLNAYFNVTTSSYKRFCQFIDSQLS